MNRHEAARALPDDVGSSSLLEWGIRLVLDGRYYHEDARYFDVASSL